jgi:heterodisulfide reductase subunit B
MEVSLYPGCSFEGVAREYRESVESVRKTLDVDFRELPDWTCCGASSAHVTDDELAVALAARNLEIAEKAARDLVVPCAACYQRLKVAEKELLQGKRVEGLSGGFRGGFRIMPIVDFFWEEVGEDSWKGKVKKSLEGLNPVCYYGCLTARPPKVTDARNPDDPQGMDRLMKSLGANVRNWSYKTDCCGGNLTLTRPDIANKLTQKLLDMAEEAGADCIVASCPMCHQNVDSRQEDISKETGRQYAVPVYYFSELMGLAFGDPSVERWLGRHMTDPTPLLRQRGLI